MATVLRVDEAKAFYDEFGSKQDSQAFYEDAAAASVLPLHTIDSTQARVPDCRLER